MADNFDEFDDDRDEVEAAEEDALYLAEEVNTDDEATTTRNSPVPAPPSMKKKTWKTPTRMATNPASSPRKSEPAR